MRIFKVSTVLMLFFVLSVETVWAEETYYLHPDNLGSTSVVTKRGSMVSKQAHYPYGANRVEIGSSPTEKGFTGQISDKDQTGLMYYNARYYDPLFAKFTQADYVNDQLNRYAYVANNPINYSDSSGNRYDQGDMGGGGGGVGGTIFNDYTHYEDSKELPENINDPFYLNEKFLDPVYYNDPLLSSQYSYWRSVVAGSPCTGCHITHTLTQNGIPTNSQIDSDLISYYRYLDNMAVNLHLTALSGVANYASYTPSIIDDLETQKLMWLEAEQAVSKDLATKGQSLTLIGAEDLYESHGLASAAGTYVSGQGITMRATGNWSQMTHTLHHEYLHYLQLDSMGTYGAATAARYAESELWVYGQMRNMPYLSPQDRSINATLYNFFNDNIGKISPLQLWDRYIGGLY